MYHIIISTDVLVYYMKITEKIPNINALKFNNQISKVQINFNAQINKGQINVNGYFVILV